MNTCIVVLCMCVCVDRPSVRATVQDDISIRLDINSIVCRECFVCSVASILSNVYADFREFFSHFYIENIVACVKSEREREHIRWTRALCASEISSKYTYKTSVERSQMPAVTPSFR